MRVTAVRKGYFGGKIRDAGEVFDLPDALMQTKPSWVAAEGEGAPRRRGRKPKQASSPTSPIDEEEEEEAPAGNGLIDALGGPPPDWLPVDTSE